jgi:hypothetical protein
MLTFNQLARSGTQLPFRSAGVKETYEPSERKSESLFERVFQ